MFAAFVDQEILGTGETADDAVLDARERDAPGGLLVTEMTQRLSWAVQASGLEHVSGYLLLDGRLGALEEWAGQWDDDDKEW